MKDLDMSASMDELPFEVINQYENKDNKFKQLADVKKAVR